MTAARDKMLARYRFESMAVDVRDQEADTLIERARKAIATVDDGELFPEGAQGRLQRAIESVQYALQQLENARADFPADLSPAEAMAELQGALRTLEAAHRAAPATKPSSPVVAAGVTTDAAIQYGEGVRFARGVEGAEQRKRYEAHYRTALAGKAAGAPAIAAEIAAIQYRQQERARTR